MALWNEQDPILKERLFGVSGPEGNHGEDVKEFTYYLDATPTHSYLKMLYKYPQIAYPYDDLVTENRRRGHDDPEYEITDTLTTRMVFAPHRADPCLRVGFRRRQPARARVGAWRVHQISQSITGVADTDFLERIFRKLPLNFTWWVNRKDHDENNVFQGGFLGLDNIDIFDRSKPLPTGGHFDQAEGTAWMAMYALQMMRIALELARTQPAYEDVATKFFEHFLHISRALAQLAAAGITTSACGMQRTASTTTCSTCPTARSFRCACAPSWG